MSLPKRVAIGRLYHESHTFIPERRRLEDCRIATGEAMLIREGDVSTLDGFLTVAQEEGWEVLPTIDLRIQPGPMLEDEVLEYWWEQFKPVLSQNLDGIFLCLHGAMSTPGFRDSEGELLRRIRQEVGPQLLVGGVTDLHANYSPAMAEYADLLLTYRENPHTDAYVVSLHAARLFGRCLRENLRPRTYLAHPGILWPPTGTGTADEPMLGLERLARQIENTQDPAQGVLEVNVHAGYSFADTPDTGLSFSVVTTGSEEEAQAHLGTLCQYAQTHRETGLRRDKNFAEVMQLLGVKDGKLPRPVGFGSGPVVLVEPSDNLGGGAPGDGTHLLHSMLEVGLQNAAIVLKDSAAVAQCLQAAPGAQLQLQVGGQSGPLSGGPVQVNVELISTSDGRFELEDKQSHTAAGWGTQVNMGPCAVVRTVPQAHNGATVTILLTSVKTPPSDLGQWRSQGVKPEELDFVVVKAAVAYRRAYDPIAAVHHYVSTPGPCANELTTFPFEQIRRPIFPLDSEA